MKTLLFFLIVSAVLSAQGRGPRPTPRIPAAGIDVPPADRAELEAGLKRLQAAAEKIRSHADWCRKVNSPYPTVVMVSAVKYIASSQDSRGFV